MVWVLGLDLEQAGEIAKGLHKGLSYSEIVGSSETGVRSHKWISQVKFWMEKERITFSAEAEPEFDEKLVEELRRVPRGGSPERAALAAATKRAVEKSASFSLERLDDVLEVGTYCLETFGNIAALDGAELKEFLKDAVSFYQVWRSFVESLQGERDALEWGLEQTLKRLEEAEREISVHRFVEDILLDQLSGLEEKRKMTMDMLTADAKKMIMT